MVNPFDAMRAYFAVSKIKDDLSKGPKPGFYSTEWWTVIFTSAALVLEVSRPIAPPTYVVYAQIGLAVLYVAVRFLLKMKHLDLPAIPGIPDLDPKQLAQLQAIVNAASASLKAPAEVSVSVSSAAPTATVSLSSDVLPK